MVVYVCVVCVVCLCLCLCVLCGVVGSVVYGVVLLAQYRCLVCLFSLISLSHATRTGTSSKFGQVRYIHVGGESL